MPISKREYSTTEKVFVYGSSTLGALLIFLVSMGFVTNVEHSGDITCGSTCISYLNVTNPKYSIHLQSFDIIYTEPQVPVDVYELEQFDGGRDYCTYYRKYYEWQKVEKEGASDNLYYCEKEDKYLPCDELSSSGKMCYVSTGEHWVPTDDRWEQGKTQLKIVGHKQPSETVKWGFRSGLTDVDPFWQGTGGADSNFAIVENDNYLFDDFEDYSKVNWDGLILYMPMNVDEDPIQDYTHYSNDASLNTSDHPDFTATGNICGGYNFNNKTKDYAQFGTTMGFNLTHSEATFAFWAKRELTGVLHPVLGSSAQRNWKRLFFAIDDNLNLELDTNNEYCSGTTSADTNWHHYVISIDSGTCFVYEDGVDTTTDSVVEDSLTGIDVIGTTDISDQFYNGTLDELMIWNRSLSKTEAINLYNYYLSNITDDYTVQSGCWSTRNVTDENSNPTFALTLDSGSGTLIKKDDTYDNFTVIFKFQKRVSSNIMLQYRISGSDYYVISPRSDNTIKSFYYPGTDQLNSTSFTQALNTWYYLKIVVDGGDHNVYNSTDGHTWEHLMYVDNSTHTSGSIQFSGGASTKVLIDDVLIQEHINPATSTSANTGTPSNSANLTGSWLYTDYEGNTAGEARVTFRKKYADYPKSDYLVAAYEMDRNCNSTHVWDIQENDNLTVTNALMTSDGKYGTAFKFDGSGDYLENTTATVTDYIDGTQERTYCTWFYPHDDASNMALYHTGSNANGQAIYFRVLDSTNKVNLDTYSNSVSSTNTVNYDEWNHVCAVLNSSYTTIYLNNVKGTPGTNNLNTANTAWRIGARTDNGDPFNGTIDEFLIWNETLSAEEVEWLYNIQRHYETPVAVSYWSFDNDADDVGLMQNGNDGTANGDASWSTAGKYGGAYEFDGDGDYIQVTNSESLNISDELSICAWVETNDNSTVQYLVNSRESGVSAMRISYRGHTDDKFRFVVSPDMSNWYGVLSSAYSTENVWHFVCGVYNGSNMLISVDGDTFTIGDAVASMPINSEDLYIGQRSDGSYSWNGTIDEVKIFDRALTEEEISFLYNNQLSLHSDDTSTTCEEWWEAYLEQTDDGGEVGTDTSQDVKIDNTDSSTPTFDYTTAWIPPTGGTGKYSTGFTPYAVCKDSCLQYANVLVYNLTDNDLVNISQYCYGQSNYTWDEYVNTTDWAYGQYYYEFSCQDSG